MTFFAQNIAAVDEKAVPGEYSVRNPITRQTYKVVYRGEGSEWNYCSCLDFKTSQLGSARRIDARYDVKIDETMNIVSDILQGTDCKVVIFSQWECMTRLLAQELDKHGVDYEYLHGGVPSVKRGEMTQRFQTDADCRVFISTDAGSTGLNLQTASIIINLDLPWNPAVLKQRIGRIYRLGQQRNVQVINLVAVGTIEERMIGKLRFKQIVKTDETTGATSINIPVESKESVQQVLSLISKLFIQR